MFIVFVASMIIASDIYLLQSGSPELFIIVGISLLVLLGLGYLVRYILTHAVKPQLR